MSGKYDFNQIEPRWQRYWQERRTFRAANPGEPGAERPKFYILDFFPYPSGAGLHVGHPLGYIATDILARFQRMRGFNVLHPMGWDAFGLPAEQYAIETGVHPRDTTAKNIDTYKRQMQLIGLSYDWERELATCDEAYYHWTQWIFLQIYNAWYDPECRWTDRDGRSVLGRARLIAELPIPPEVKQEGPAAIAAYRDEHRLAYLAEVPVNWCPALGTVLSNEEVTNEGRSERGDHPVYRRPMRQWMLRITDYADRLLSDLDDLEWPEPIKLMQRNWIGRSEGAYVDFALADGSGNVIRVFTTRPDTLFGSTYVVLAPEHRLVSIITTPEQRREVNAYVQQARQKSDLARTADAKEKSGVFTGAYAVNPVTEQRVPIWVADYVLATYGTGSIMAVPAHDQRDFDFARQFKLPIRDVIYPRTVGAMKYFAEHAVDLVGESNWREQLADFLGLVTGSGFGADQLEAALTLVRQRRAEPTGHGAATLEDLPQRLGVTRGVIRATWLDALEGLSLRSWAQFQDLFRRAGFYAHSGEAHESEGVLANSRSAVADFDGVESRAARPAITAWLREHDRGEGTVQYKLRDWLFSRQRYWGEPFPIVYREDGQADAVADSELPVRLPDLADFRPVASDDPNADPQTPLSRAPAEWRVVTEGGRPLRRELNTMPQWAGSCWYYLRFADPRNERVFVDRAAERYWLGGRAADGKVQAGGVDLYLGGAEHAVLHLLYARFWHKVLYDLEHVGTPEPFQKLFNQGMIQGIAYRDGRGAYVAVEDVEFRDDRPVHQRTGEALTSAVEKMSKSLKNVVNPDAIIHEYGADTLRLYEMYMGPLEASKPWNTRDIVGVHRFLQRVWRLVVVEDGDNWKLNPAIGPTRSEPLERLLHKTIRKVEADMQRFAFNTAIAQMIVWANEAQKSAGFGRDQIERFILVLAPFAPHLCEELWQRLGHAESLAAAAWPRYDEALTRDDEVEIAVQVNGKIRARMMVPADAAEDAVVRSALDQEVVAREVAGRPPRKVIFVKGRLLNLIV